VRKNTLTQIVDYGYSPRLIDPRESSGIEFITSMQKALSEQGSLRNLRKSVLADLDELERNPYAMAQKPLAQTPWQTSRAKSAR